MIKFIIVIFFNGISWKCDTLMSIFEQRLSKMEEEYILKEGGVHFNYLHQRGGGTLKNLKRGWEYGAGSGLFKRGGGGCNFSCLICSRFIIFTFWNYFILCKIALCIWRKKKLFCHHNFMKKVIRSDLKWTWKYPINQNNLFVKGFERLKIDFW